MKLSFHSIIFKTLLSLFLSSSLFIGFIGFTTKESFSKAFISLIHEDISSIKSNIAPSIALNLSYNFIDSIDDISHAQLTNEKILLIRIESKFLQKSMQFSNVPVELEQLSRDGHFISSSQLIDPATNENIGQLTLVYSNKSYKDYMKKFYEWFSLGLLLFVSSMFGVGYFLYSSLKSLNILALSFNNFDPSHPKEFTIKLHTKDEVSIISQSANNMTKRLIDYISKIENLSELIKHKEAHLKDAQRMAKVGSFDYDVVNNTLHLSDEYYRILGIKLSTTLSWKEFLKFISLNDYQHILHNIEYAIKNGSRFNVTYSILIKGKEERYIQTKGKVRKKEDGSVKLTAVSLDITNDVENQKTIDKLAYYDALTGLANRTLLKDRMYKAIQNAKRNNEQLAVLFLDLDHFKLINDTLGHSVGDELLIFVSQLLHKQIRESDTLSRFGGDEFVILISSIKDKIAAEEVAKKIVDVLQQKHDIATHQLYITSSVGISLYPKDGITADELIRNADTAMYEAKNDGRNKYKIYSQNMGNFIDKQLNLEQDLMEAVKSVHQIEVYYQAKINTKNKEIYGAEALVRWRHPTKGLIFPDQFIYIAESTGLMIEMGNLIIEQSIQHIKEFNKLGFSHLKIAINLSARQFQDSNLVSFISIMLNKYQINPSQIEFEITESVSMSNMNNTLRILQELKALGTSIAIDDFGTGHSSLAYLKKFPINILKVDQSFVFGIIDNEDDKILTQTVISMAHSLGLKTVAEGVETKEHVEILEKLGCDYLQGYFYSKPIAKKDFIDLLQKYKTDIIPLKINN